MRPSLFPLANNDCGEPPTHDLRELTGHVTTISIRDPGANRKAAPIIDGCRDAEAKSAMSTYLLVSIAVLAGLLFLPVSKLIWVLSVRRMERKLERKLDQGELDGQRQRARLIALLLVLPFSYLFNLSLLG